jgi:hypothetical protein
MTTSDCDGIINIHFLQQSLLASFCKALLPGSLPILETGAGRLMGSHLLSDFELAAVLEVGCDSHGCGR